MRRITLLLSSISSQRRDLLSTERFSALPIFRLTPSKVFGCLLTQYVFNEVHIKGGSNMTGTDLCINKPYCAAAVRP